MKKNKKLFKVLISAAVCAVIILGIVIYDRASVKTSLSYTEESAEQYITETLKSLPLTVSKTSNKIAEMIELDVSSVEVTNPREITVRLSYSAPDVAALYNANKDKIFSSAIELLLKTQQSGGSFNATKIRQTVQPVILEALENAQRKNGELDVYIYELDDGSASLYLSNEMINTLYGGIVDVWNDIDSTKSVSYEGKDFDFGTNNSLRNGISDCFKLKNYSSDKPDTATPLVKRWNSFCDEFYRNFIHKNQWLYLAKGLGTTLGITGISLVLGTLLGFLTAVIRVTAETTGKLPFLSKLCSLYITIIRGTPVMIQLLIIYFVILLPIGIEKFPAAVLCFGINSGAYVSEIIRGGIMSLDIGQTEAGRSLGFNYVQTMWYIVFPQAFKAVLPSLCNEFIALLKETSVAFYIGVSDLTRGGLKIRSITYSNFMPLIAIALIYLAVVLILTKLVGLLERRLRRSER